ncbi:hypothetical protein ACIA47_16710 [Micromonospora sp. NPDC051227]|uniref:hypothetical protein n=1 Tax=Micromonospora sp. NPDC051227 TaxID=3364285 RepID=UPI00378D0191
MAEKSPAASDTPAKVAVPLHRSFSSLPDLPDTTADADYLQVTGIDGLDATNRALATLFTHDPATVAARMSLPAGSAITYHQRSSRNAVVHTNGALVSILAPVSAESVEGFVTDYWLATTLTVPQAAEVKITDLFSSPTAATDALSDLVRRRLPHSDDECIKGSWDPDYASAQQWHASDTYAKFAMTPDGLVIGFAKGRLIPPPCGIFRMTFSWEELRPLMADRGRRLVAQL